MTFTDEDLKRLKIKAEGDQVSLSHFQIEALIARLEAAEACISVKADSFDIWRNAAGK